MIEGRTVLAVVPARGGSKGIPKKNLRPAGGRPLIVRVGDVVRQVKEVDRAIVSTDDREIADAAAGAGLDAPFLRPTDLSSDTASSLDVVIHALTTMEMADGRRYDIVVLLEPTSPLRTAEQVSAAIAMLVDGGWDSVWTVSETDSKAHPLKQLVVTDGSLEFYDPRGADVTARQQLRPVFHRNGVAYALTRDCLLSQGTLKGRRAAALPIAGTHVSVDTEDDLALVEWILARRQA